MLRVPFCLAAAALNAGLGVFFYFNRRRRTCSTSVFKRGAVSSLVRKRDALQAMSGSKAVV
jgi:hypothetical protein